MNSKNGFRGFELNKHKAEDEQYYHYLKNLPLIFDEPTELVNQFPVYAGYVNAARCLMFYDLYTKTLELNGHIGDFGTYKGFSFLWFAKLVKLMEPYNTTTVHGFDWFKGMAGAVNDNPEFNGKYTADDERINKILELQGLDNIAYLHKMDLSKELNNFLSDNPHMRFKLVFVDCGIKDVLSHTIKYIWPRIVNGGVLILDHYNMSVSPSESNVVDSIIGDRSIQTLPYVRQPSGFVIK